MKRNLGLTAAFRHAKWLAALGLILAALALSLVLDLSGAIQPYRLKTLDALFRRVPLPAASPEVVVVTVDQPDLDFFKNQGVTWPWPRQLYAPLIDYCRWAGAKAVIFDILFTEASSYGPEDDQRLAQAAAAAGNVALPFFLSREAKPPNPSEADLLKKAGLTIPGPPPRDQPSYRSVVTPIPPLLRPRPAPWGTWSPARTRTASTAGCPWCCPLRIHGCPPWGSRRFTASGPRAPCGSLPAPCWWGTCHSPGRPGALPPQVPRPQPQP